MVLGLRFALARTQWSCISGVACVVFVDPLVVVTVLSGISYGACGGPIKGVFTGFAKP